MKKRFIVILLVTAFVMLLIPNTALAAEPSLVSSMDYNGHHYEIYYQSGISWTNAKAYAENMEYNGQRGYLATVTTIAEHNAVASLNPSYADSFLGARGTIGDRVSTWKWVTGPEAGQPVMGSRPPWMSGEPNSSSEKYLIIRANNLWDNRAVTNTYVRYFIVEYGGLGPIPETSYDITYNNVAGAANSNPSSYCASDTPLTLQDLGARGGYTFGGWYDNAELSGSAVTAIPEDATGAQTFWAKWTQDDYTVSYSGSGSNGGTVPSDGTVYHYQNQVTVLSGEPTKTGYAFGGWSNDEDIYHAGDTFEMPAHSVTLTAQWTAIDYTVTYSGNGNNGGTVPSDDTVYHYQNQVTVLSGEPTKTGYAFGGWSDDEDIYHAGDTFEMPAHSVTLTAQWIAIDYTVTYSGNGNDGGTVPNDTVYHYEDEVTVLSDQPTKTGYTFSGWNDGANTYNSGDKFDMPSDDVVLTAQWTAIDYTVTYNGDDSNGGTVPNDDTVYHYEDEVTVLSDQPAKTGYTFSGWSDGTNTYNSGDKFYMPGDDVALTAQWTPIDYTVTYNGNGSNGGTVPSDNTIYHYADEVTVLPDEPTKTGYTFSGWSDGTTTYNSGDKFNMPADDVALTAQWTAIDYTVTYNGNGSNGGTVPSDNTIYHYADEVTVLPDEPTKTGYTFSGWSDGTTTYNSGDKFNMPADDVALTAQWNKKWVTSVTINKSSVTLKVGKTMQLSAKLLPEDVINATVTWTSSNEAVAAVDADGQVTALGEGSAKISATAGSKSDVCTITVSKEETLQTIAPAETSEPEISPTPTTTQTLTITPSKVQENDGAYIIEISIDSFPEGTTSIQLPGGQIISLDDKDIVQITVGENEINEDGSVEIVLLNDEGMPLYAYDVQVIDNGIAVSIPNARRAWRGLLSVFIWIAIGILCVGIIIFIIVFVRKHKKTR